MAEPRRVGVAARYSDLVILGDTAHFSGYVPENSEGLTVREQTQDVLDQIEQSLREIGSNKTKLLRATIWLSSMGFYDEMNGVWDAWLERGHAPARVCVESRLANPAYALEIQVTAAL
ncbi:RidA family protein [Microvirga pudoricolor]|uniref:RidA family protein n=1 Tax=Microvirga pudoricolor TaxID=2778729 RepID=UPI00194E789C|nr:RidA family protein [Microvirga pudoricolor]MBM6592499.1 RidA family protein [Microvirga pudoricolor]